MTTQAANSHRVTIHHADGRTDTYRDATAALAAELGISRPRLCNLLMAATLGNVDELAAGLSERYSLPLRPVEQALGILAALSARKAEMDAARLAVLESDRDDMRPQAAVVAAAGDYRALANALEELSNEIR